MVMLLVVKYLHQIHHQVVNTIEKFPFATDTNATDIGDLTQARGFPCQDNLQLLLVILQEVVLDHQYYIKCN
jgi:hypothetical protein